MTALTATELADLRDLEAVIAGGIQQFHAVGRALMEVQTRGLYKHSHRSWEDYCRDRWGFSRSRAFRLITAAGVADDVLPIGQPLNERQARELAPLPAEQRRQVWEEAQAEGRPTAERVAELTRKALAGMPAEEAARVIRGEEEALGRRAKARQEADLAGAHKKHLGKIRWFAKQIIRHADALGGDDGQTEADLARQIIASVDARE